jgi:hypothetical protein
MASLTAHLVESGGHGRLGFHASCPVCCQERLFGSLSSDGVVSRRAQAALASGVLALSAVGPPVAAAQEPDQQLEGGSGAGQAPGGGETGSAVEAPGSGSAVAPPTEVVPPPAPDIDPVAHPEAVGDSVLREIVPVETAPIEAPSPPAAPPAAPGSDALPDSSEPTPRPEASPPNPAPEASVDEPEPAPPPPEVEESEPSEGPKPKPRENPPPPAESPPPPQPSAAVPPPPSVPAEPTAPAPAVEPQPTVTPSSAASTKPGRFLVVQPGDSLWSIAKRLLGPDASPAEIARKVSRLWELNAARIGTGRPDLILVGTKLELR